MLYIWPLFAFFSAPLLLPTVLQPILTLLFGPAPAPPPPSSSSSKAARGASAPTSTLSKILNIAGYASLVPTALAIVKFNTIIHPFTLADNRHYMFYVFRYSILRAPWVRYALVPIYIIAGVLCIKTLGGTPPSPLERKPTTPGTNANGAVRIENEKANSHSNNNSQTTASSATAAITTTTTNTTIPPTLSTTLLFLLTTTLSLMTAPLVEPRYFILPWVFWRLLLPSSSSLSLGQSVFRQGSSGSSSSNSNNRGGNNDFRLWLETAWFGVINVATMYIFITRPFRWASEEGLQRFMW